MMRRDFCDPGGAPSAQVDFAALRRKQEELAARVVLQDRLGPVRLVAGTDLSAGPYAPTVWASVVVFAWPGLELVDSASVVCEDPFPYRTGLLGFREVPPLVSAFERLSRWPDLAIVDGQGLAHPRRFGLACHLGLELDLPTIGCAKSRLVGEPGDPLGDTAGAAVPMLDAGERIGYVVRGRAGCKPLWVSPGHRVSAELALEWVRRLLGPYRLPIPQREAHRLANRARRGESPATRVNGP